MSAEEQAIHSRLAVVESQVRDVKDDVVRFEKHIAALYGKIDALTMWVIASLAAMLANLAVLLFKG